MQSFNLVTDPWIEVQSGSAVGLMEIFSNPQTPMLAGAPIEKLSIFKLLLAVAQEAYAPSTEAEWATRGLEFFRAEVLRYLENHRSLFDLYGDRPFLQYPELEGRCRDAYIGNFLPHVASGNTTVLFDSQQPEPLSHAARARLLVSQQGFSFGGKKPDNSFTLTQGYEGKSKTAKAGSSLGFMGFLHNFWIDKESISKSVWLNLFSAEAARSYLNKKVGSAPWVNRPAGEDCQVARDLKASYMGRLVPLGRFCLIKDDNLLITEGVSHPSYLEGVSDPSVALKPGKPKPKILWVNPEIKPWRQLPALLSYLGKNNEGFDCPQIRLVSSRIKDANLEMISLWSCGTAVRSNAGEQYLSGRDDSVDSLMNFPVVVFQENWYERFKAHFEKLDEIAKIIYGSVSRFYSEMKADGSEHAKRASAEYWLGMEDSLNELVALCQDEGTNAEGLESFKNRACQRAAAIYDRFTSQSTARQLSAWAKQKPNFSFLGKKPNSGKSSKGQKA